MNGIKRFLSFFCPTLAVPSGLPAFAHDRADSEQAAGADEPDADQAVGRVLAGGLFQVAADPLHQVAHPGPVAVVFVFESDAHRFLLRFVPGVSCLSHGFIMPYNVWYSKTFFSFFKIIFRVKNGVVVLGEAYGQGVYAAA